MRKEAAAAGSTVFMALAPGTFAGAIPAWMTRWHFRTPVSHYLPVRIVGGTILVIAAAFLVHAFARFVIDGLGTPAPLAPTEHLVITGVYRYLRNPMYVAVTAAIVAQSLMFGQPGLLIYALGFLAVTAAFARWYEEPTLTRQFPNDYPAYRSAVRGWWPRWRHPYSS
jgi:protein-S-isoprenylcysteine O-methyltransferase Ste14